MISPTPRIPGRLAQKLRLINPPVCEPILQTLEEETLRVQVATATWEGNNRIASARRTIEKYIRRPLVQQTWDMFVDDERYLETSPLFSYFFDYRPWSQYIEIELPLPPFLCLGGVWTRWWSGNEILQQGPLVGFQAATDAAVVANPGDIYWLSSADDAARIRLIPDSDWTEHRGFEGFRIRLTAGYVIPFKTLTGGNIATNGITNLGVGSTFMISSPSGVPPQGMQFYTPYTITAIVDPPNNTTFTIVGPGSVAPVTVNDTTDWFFIGEIPDDIIRALIMIAGLDQWASSPGRLFGAGRFAPINFPIDPLDLLNSYVKPYL
jgi:hypothetical protein